MTDAPDSRSLMQRARSVRDCLELCLTQPLEAGDQEGNRWEQPPVSPEFHLVSVAVGGTHDAPQVEVVFTWDGEEGTFGMRFPIRLGNSFVDESPDALISVYVDENLLALGMGVENAERQYGDDGVAWLTWPTHSGDDR